jgi:membrane-bound ClpP family serine protease
MSAVHRLPRTKGLDLVLHTPGGEMAATESLVDYLRSMFGRNVRAIVPQLAMSAGTMIALSCREIVMGKHSSLGPIDPQIEGIAAHGVIEEFAQAVTEIQANPAAIPMWQPIIAKYPPTFIGECQKAISLANDMVQTWLETGMFARDPQKASKAKRIIEELADHALTKSHARHISMQSLRNLDVKVRPLEGDQRLQDAVLSLHHATVLTLQQSAAVKIIENQNGVAFIQSVQVVEGR